MKNVIVRRIGRSKYLEFLKKHFTVGNNGFDIIDTIDVSHPLYSQRRMQISGTSAYYSSAPILPFIHSTCCYDYCMEAMRLRDGGLYRHALVMGCGGGSVPRWILQTYKDCTVDVVDISPEMISICRKYFMRRWNHSRRLTYTCGDAGKFEQKNYQYQFIFCDLFDGTRLVPLVSTLDFARRLRDLISDDGILVINCGWAQLQLIRKVYQNFFGYVQPADRGLGQTRVLIASDTIYKGYREDYDERRWITW